MDLIGLDIGSTGTKCLIMASTGEVLAQAYREYAMESPASGCYELNPQKVWEAVKAVLGSAMNMYDRPHTRLAGLSVSSFGEAAVLLDNGGNVLGNSLLYIDKRGSRQLEALVEHIGEENITSKTGLHPHPMYTLSKLMWYREEQPDIYERLHTFLPFGSFILFKLGARPVIDYSLASRTMAFDVHRLGWDEDIIQAARLKRGIFPEAQELGSRIGQILPSAAEALGLPAHLQLVLGGHDQVCAAIGAGVTEEGSAVDGIGTVECITPVFRKMQVNDQALAASKLALVPYIQGKYTTYAFNFTGGSLLKWFRDQFGYEEKCAADESGRSVYEIMGENAGEGPTDLLVLPHFAGSGTPYMNPAAAGVIAGLNFNTTKGELYRALMEGVTYEMRLNLDCLEQAGMSIGEIKACGGGAKSGLWLQIKADIMNRPITALDIEEAGILGAIMLAGVALGVFPSFEDAAHRLVKVNTTYYPRPDNRKHYDENYAKYNRLYQAVNNVMSYP
ncbi:FGGY-family carbohydrate kinase [Paenibacillus sp. FSL H7-0756]|uniref:FGGY-family carbohydrate kinase n=1 Tax=Paenibacillus sp. FSL H7-0756 TaxID=2954738 RepID=UPI0030FB840C